MKEKELNIEIGGGLTLLTITFVLLKVFGYIDWSWWLVLLPTWGPIALGLGILAVWLAILLLVFIVGCILALFGK